ncbi:hypothetical protein [Umezawaea beigongshangensis]|nr:hypothetical protein [Umezawaea beigongshangensis]
MTTDSTRPAPDEDPDDFAEEVGVDPTPQEVAEYERLVQEHQPRGR